MGFSDSQQKNFTPPQLDQQKLQQFQPFAPDQPKPEFDLVRLLQAIGLQQQAGAAEPLKDTLAKEFEKVKRR